MSEASAKRSDLQTYLRLFKYLRPLLLPFVVSIVGFVIFAASQPMLAKLMEWVVGAINNGHSDARWSLPLIVVGIFLFRGIGSFLGTYYNAYVANRLVTNMRMELFNHLTVLPVNYFHANSGGQIFQRLTGSIMLISYAFTEVIRIIIREGLTIIFLLAYVFYLNWKLSLTFLAIAPFLLLIINYTSKRFRTLTKKNEGILSSLLQTISEIISGHEVMRVFGGRPYEIKRHEDAAEDSFKNSMKIRKVAAISTPVVQLLVAVALAFIIFLLLSPSVLAEHSSAELIGYLTAVALLPKSMRQLGGLNVHIQRAVTGAELIFEFMDSLPEMDSGKYESARVSGHIIISDVTFRYKQNQDPVLNHITADISPGQMVALVGKSGSGKSTVFALLQRAYNIEEGSISIDGIDIRNYKLANLRTHIALISQNLVLFNDTVKNNIAYGELRGLPYEKIREAAQRAHALEFIEKLPLGFDTIIGDNGLELSGGQRQRLAIARAFLKDAPILLMDEATSALDNESERHIQTALEEVMQGRTTIVIAHRLSTIEKADRILVMSKGHIVEQGAHTDLLKLRGIYYDLYTSKEL